MMHGVLVFLDSKAYSSKLFVRQGKLQAVWSIALSYIVLVTPIVLIVMSAVYTFSVDARMCSSELQWRRWFRNKDEAVIRSIQDAYRCCGLNSMRDQAWPFPSRNTDASTCQRTSGFRTHCGPLWQDQLQATAVFCIVASILLHLLSVSQRRICAMYVTEISFRYNCSSGVSSSGLLKPFHQLILLGSKPDFCILSLMTYKLRLIARNNDVSERTSPGEMA